MQKNRLTIAFLMTSLFLFESCSSDKSTEPSKPSVDVPVLTTTAVTGITRTSALCGGTITSSGGASVSARGVCWSTNQTPTIADNKTEDGTGTGSFSSYITGLATDEAYYVRAYATNSAGTGYGGIADFITIDSTGTVMDIDGNTYQTVKIGSQWWMAENLKVTHYRNGAELPNVTDNTSWQGLTTGACCNSHNDTSNAAIYGRLYNWYAVQDTRNIAPAGWHVATAGEWQTLIDYLGGEAVAGGKMKEAGTTHWVTPNTGATNESGFTGLPGDMRLELGYFGSIGYHALFWSATSYDSDNARAFELAYDFAAAIGEYDPKKSGFSIRCIRN